MHSGTKLTTVKFQAEPASASSRQLASGSAQDEVVLLKLLYLLFLHIYLMLGNKLVTAAKGMARCVG